MLTDYPYALVVLYALPLLAIVSRARLLPLALTVAAAGIAEFAICTLADAIDTHRHLFLFHVITETLFLLAAGWALTGRSRVPPELP